MGGETAIAAGLGAVGSLFGASQASRAEKRSADQMLQLSEPYLTQARAALPRLRALMESYYAPRLGQDSPFLHAEHAESLAGLQRANAQGLAEIQHTYGSQGNLGRARGERLRLSDQLLRATSRENLSYGEAQDTYRDTVAGQYQEILAALAGLGRTGVQYASQGLKQQADASETFWNAFAKVFWSAGNWEKWVG